MLSSQEHRDLTCPRDVSLAAWAREVFGPHPVVIATTSMIRPTDSGDDAPACNVAFQLLARFLERRRLAGQLTPGNQARERLERAHARRDRRGDEVEHLGGQRTAKVDRLAVRICRRVSASGGRTSVTSPLQPRLEAILQAGDLVRVAVAHDDDLFMRLVESVEGVKELVLASRTCRREIGCRR
jgi:hypothetical protein